MRHNRPMFLSMIATDRLTTCASTGLCEMTKHQPVATSQITGGHQPSLERLKLQPPFAGGIYQVLAFE